MKRKGMCKNGEKGWAENSSFLVKQSLNFRGLVLYSHCRLSLPLWNSCEHKHTPTEYCIWRLRAHGASIYCVILRNELKIVWWYVEELHFV